jgi:hypothetical protein
MLFLLLIGLFTFRDYGLSWDEPLFYDYGQASRYAYSISARLDGTFDIEKSYGASAGDHVTRGPAYLLLGGIIEGLLERTGLDLASSWHLTNFLAYLVGLIFFYLLSRTWLDAFPAALSTSFFASQPLLWNHAFINPKDSAFSVFFLVTVFLSFRMIDKWDTNRGKNLLATILPGIFLGITTAIRFLGPYAAILAFIYFLSKPNNKNTWWGFIPYALIAIFTMVALWPFLWDDPISRFLFVLRAMSDTSANLKTLFWGREYHGYELPRRYFPTMLAITLTEPTWLFFLVGLITTLVGSFRKRVNRVRTLTLFLWFGIVISLLLIINPPNSDGYRHYLFILPPVFLFAGVGISETIKFLRPGWMKSILALLVLTPAILGNITLHPYEYTYYNSFVGGTKSAFREFETDYWLTCYKESVEEINKIAPEGTRIYIKREAYIAAYYARPDLSILEYRGEFGSAQEGDLLLVNTRTNDDERVLKNAPILMEIGRQGAVFCVIKKVP